MGDKIRTIQNLEIIKSDIENNLIFIKGSVPGSKNSFVLIKKTSKKINRTTTLDKSKNVKVEETKKVAKKDTKPEVKNEKKTVQKDEAKKTEPKKDNKK